MRLFARALKEALRYWKMLVLGASMLLRGRGAVAREYRRHLSDHRDHAPRRIAARFQPAHSAESEATIQRLTGEIAALEAQAPAANRPRELSRRIDALRGQVQTEQYHLRSSRWLQPYLDRFLPGKAFPTVLLIVAFVLGRHGGQANLVARRHDARQLRVAIDRPRHADANFQQGADAGSGRLQYASAPAAFPRTSCKRPTCWPAASRISTAGRFNEPLRIIVCLVGAMVVSWRLTLLRFFARRRRCFSIVWLNRKMREHVAAFLEPLARLPPRDARSLRLAANRAGIHDGRLRTRAVPRRHEGNAAIRDLAAYYNALANPLTEIFGIGMLCTALAVTAYLILNQETTHLRHHDRLRSR